MVRKSRRTRQKDILDSEIIKAEVFFTAEDLLERVKKIDASIGIATIYRYLKQKIIENELHSYSCRGKKLYSVEKRNHSHFICKKCGKTIHLDIADISAIKNSIRGEICHFQLDVYGVCENCKKLKDNSVFPLSNSSCNFFPSRN